MSSRIRFGEPIELPLHSEKLPSTSFLVDPLDSRRDEPFQVYITQKAYDKAWQHVCQSLHIECGGILIGHPFQAFGRQDITFVVIADALVQDSDNRSVGHFTVGPELINKTRTIMEQKGYLSVGWYHSHPDHGVFLSGQDMTIVRSIYNSQWHVAWVIDPQRRKEAFFQGPKGKRLARWYLLSDEPPFVKANALYKLGKDALESSEGNINLAKKHFRHLKLILDDKPSLAHWRETGLYQYVQDTLNNLVIDGSETLSQESVRISFPEADVVRNDDSMNLSERYNEGKEYIRRSLNEYPPNRGEMKIAQQILEWEKLSKYRNVGYRSVGRFIKPIKEILRILDSISGSRDLDLDDERELEKWSGELKNLLQSDGQSER